MNAPAITTTTTTEAIWAGDRLERRRDATYLSTFLFNRYIAKPQENGFVLALNGDWGTGKSFMLQRWRDDLRHQGHPAIYFDAWENDYTPQPLIAFIATLNEGLSEYSKLIPHGTRLRNKLIQKLAPAIAPTIKAVGYTAIKTLTGISASKLDDLYSGEESDLEAGDLKPSEIAKAAAKQVQQAVAVALKDHTSTKKAISAFRSVLSSIVKGIESANGIQLPLYIFVDELDRCRPNYAIELLEGIKHLFGVPGIYFVIATNMTQLGEATKAIYGPTFDGHQYLKRFFDIEYTLPDPAMRPFARELFEHAAIPAGVRYVFGTLARAADLSADEAMQLESLIFARYAEAFKLKLRDQEQTMRIVEASILTLHPRPIHIYFLLFLAMVYQKSPQIYRTFSQAKHTGDRSGIDLVYSRDYNIGGIPIPQPYFERRLGPTPEILPIQLVEHYLTAIRNPETSTNRPNTYDFPQNLVYEIFSDSGERDRLEDYFDIVQRAGAFTQRQVQ